MPRVFALLVFAVSVVAFPASAAAAAGKTSNEIVEIAVAITRAGRNCFLFRRPTGLADGLTLKEPASHAIVRDSPQLLGSPVPRRPTGSSA